MGVAKVVAKFFGWLVVGSLALLVLLYAMLFALNFHDELPSKAALQLNAISNSKPVVRDEENAYVFIYGFSIDRQYDPVATGQMRVAWLREKAKQSGQAYFDKLPGKSFDRSTLNLFNLDKLFTDCRAISPDCLNSLQRNQSAIQNVLDENAWLLARYENLLGRKAWVETAPFDGRMPLPEYSTVFTAQILLYMQAWIDAGKGDTAKVKQLLDLDLQFWRRVLMSSDLLITKMISTAAIARNFSWGSAVLSRLQSDGVAMAVPDSWKQPINEDEYSMLRCMVGEWEFSNGMLQQQSRNAMAMWRNTDESSAADRALSFFAEPMIKPQDLSNLHAELIIKSLSKLDVPFSQYPAAIESAQADWDKRDYLSLPHVLYNPVGKLIFSFSSWDFANYANRVRDLEGLRRASLLIAKLHSMSVAATDVPVTLQTIGINDPYSESLFAWDEKVGALVFQGLEKGERGRHLVLY